MSESDRTPWLWQRSHWERTVLGLLAAAIAYQIFVDPIVGTADNRDWWRVTKQLGIAYLDAPGPDATFFKNIQREYTVVAPQDVQYLTSELLLGRVARAVSGFVSKDGLFDLRWMGCVHALAYLAATGVFLAAFHRRSRRARIAVGAFVLVTLSDVRIVSYFNSFYCENAQVIFLIAALGFAMLGVDAERPARQRALLYAAFLACSSLFFFAKTQDLVFCAPFAVIAYRLLPRGGWRPRAAIALTVLALFVWGMASDAYAVTHRVNIGVTLQEEILPHSKTPEKDLQELGDGDVANVTFARIALFYAKRPHRWWTMCRRRMKQAFTHVPFGNFEPATAITGASNAFAESQAFEAFGRWKDRHYPRSPWFWIACAVGYVVLLSAKLYAGRTERDRALAILNLMLVAGCVLQLVAVITFEANGTEKHFFIFNVLVDFVLLLAGFELAALAALVRERWRLARSLQL